MQCTPTQRGHVMSRGGRGWLTIHNTYCICVWTTAASAGLHWRLMLRTVAGMSSRSRSRSSPRSRATLPLLGSYDGWGWGGCGGGGVRAYLMAPGPVDARQPIRGDLDGARGADLVQSRHGYHGGPMESTRATYRGRQRGAANERVDGGAGVQGVGEVLGARRARVLPRGQLVATCQAEMAAGPKDSGQCTFK
jgi:hypothetical protein